MEKIILLHGSGHGPESWEETAALLPADWETLRPGLSAILGGREAGFENLRDAFERYCAGLEGPLHLCGLSLGGILALDYALAHPERVKSLVLIGTPHRVPKAAFAVQNLVFRLLPESAFRGMAFGKRDTFALGRSMKALDFSPRLDGAACPALVLCGAKDRANLASAEYLARHMKNARLKILPGTGHVVNEEAPETLAEILTDFYRAQP